MSEDAEDIVSGYLHQQKLRAMPAMDDPNFSRSVTLLCQHNEDGAIGITINRQSEYTLGELFLHLNISCEDTSTSSLLVLEGGPVNPDRGFVIHTPMEGFDSSLKINEDIMVTTSRDVIAAIAEGKGPQQFQVALGYAGWSDGQLESEMRENAWLSVPADKGILFESALKNRWEKAVGILGINISDLHGVGGHA